MLRHVVVVSLAVSSPPTTFRDMRTHLKQDPLNHRDTAEPPFVVEMDGCRRAFGSVLALPPVTMRVERGAVCLVTGPNGSGKTTLLRLAAGRLQPSGGTVTTAAPVLYVSAGDGARLPQTIEQAVGFAASVAVGDPEEALEVTRLAGRRQERVGGLSAGQRARVTLAVVLAAAPVVACLDEPDAHLDLDSRAVAADVIDLLAARGTAVLLATHDRRWVGDREDAHLHLGSVAP